MISKRSFPSLSKKCSTVVYYSLYVIDFFYTLPSFLGWVTVAGQVWSLFSPPSDPASLENQPILQPAQPAIHPGEPKFPGVSSAPSLFLEESLHPLFLFNLFMCPLTNSSHPWNKVGHCQLLQSQGWTVSSYTCFPSGFPNKFLTEALERALSIRVSQETSTGNAGSRMGQDTAHRHKCVTEGSLLSTATTGLTCWELCL